MSAMINSAINKLAAYLFRFEYIMLCLGAYNPDYSGPENEESEPEIHWDEVIANSFCIVFDHNKQEVTFSHSALSQYRIPFSAFLDGTWKNGWWNINSSSEGYLFSGFRPVYLDKRLPEPMTDSSWELWAPEGNYMDL